MRKLLMSSIHWFVVGVLLGLSSIAHARWADPADATYVVNFEHRHYKIRKDGSATTTIETQIEILKDSARDTQGLTRFTYDASISKIKILEAKTINKDGTIDVPKLDREDKPLASSGPGFDVINQITIGFPRVNVGSKLYLKTEETQSRALIPDYFFSLNAIWGRAYQKLTADYDSDRPIYFHAFDPEGVLNVTSSEKHVHFELKAPYYRNVVEEANEFYNNKSYVWTSVSTQKDWSEFPHSTLQAYEDDLNSRLPASYQAILEKARAQKTPIDQINTVTSELASQIRYVGEWRELEGLWHPRALDVIAQTSFGDCKDFSVSTGAILRKLGFDVHVAWTMRRREWESGPLDDVALDLNHAIVYAVKDGQTYWVDPTNLTSQAQAIYADIANRQAYVLGTDHLELKTTPAMKSSEGSMTIRKSVVIDPLAPTAEGSIDFKGRSAEAWTGEELKSAKSGIDFNLIGWITDRSRAFNWKVGDYDLKSRIVKDLGFTYSYSMENSTEQTTAGIGFEVNSPFFVEHFRARGKDRVTDLLLANPQMLNREITLTGREVQMPKTIKCEGDSPWAAFSRHIGREPNGVKLEDHLEIKTLHVAAKDMQTEEFAKFQREILACMQETIVVFK